MPALGQVRMDGEGAARIDPVDIEDISSDWLTQALGRDVHLVASDRIGTGQTGATYRLTVGAADGDDTSTIIAKVATGGPAARQQVSSGYLNEVGFYGELADTLDVRTPHCWYAAITDDSTRFTLLLEDLRPRLPGVQADGCSPARAEGAVRNLSGLHASRWNDPSLFAYPFMARSSRRQAALLGGLTRSAVETFVDRYQTELGATDVDTLRASAGAIEHWVVMRKELFSVTHGDYRLDNLMFGEDDRDVVVVDWQTSAIAPPARDLAYFLGTSLDTDDRRASEHDLVDIYHADLVARGVTGYTRDRCFEDYRLGQLQAPMITILGVHHSTAARSDGADEMFLAMARRSCAAIRDLQTLDLV